MGAGDKKGSVIVIDNGAGSIKAGFAGEENPRIVMPNCLAKLHGQAQPLIGEDTVDKAPGSQMTFYRPFDRGQLINWEMEVEIWQRLLNKQHLGIRPSDHSLLLTYPYCAPVLLQETCNEVIFEEYGFRSYYRCPSSSLSVYKEQIIEAERRIAAEAEVKLGSTRSATLNRTNSSGFGGTSPRPRSLSGASAAAAAMAAASAPPPPPSPLQLSSSSLLSSPLRSHSNPWVSSSFGPIPPTSSDVIMVVDSGFSYTHCMPFVSGKCIQHAMLRLNIGGKLLTNALKKAVSKQWNMMDEFQVLDQAKEALCYVTSDFNRDMEICAPACHRKRKRPRSDITGGGGGSYMDRASIVREFVMPDFVSVYKGYVLQNNGIRNSTEGVGAANENGGNGDDGGGGGSSGSGSGSSTGQPGGHGQAEASEATEVMTLEKERFTVPELLFRPSDIGMRQIGIAQCIKQSIKSVETCLQPSLWSNVLLVGGNAALPGMKERMEMELRQLAPEWCQVGVTVPTDPIMHPWQGGSKFAVSEEFSDFAVTKKEYEEQGHRICLQRFNDW